MLKSRSSVGRGSVAKLGDFGLAVKLKRGERSRDNHFRGTITHMAPEVLLHGRLSRASDVYSFGILLWQLFTGATLYSGLSAVGFGFSFG